MTELCAISKLSLCLSCSLSLYISLNLSLTLSLSLSLALQAVLSPPSLLALQDQRGDVGAADRESVRKVSRLLCKARQWGVHSQRPRCTKWWTSWQDVRLICRSDVISCIYFRNVCSLIPWSQHLFGGEEGHRVWCILGLFTEEQPTVRLS